MGESDFPDYAYKVSKEATDSRSAFSGEQVTALEDIIWNIASKPDYYTPISTPGPKGRLLYKDTPTGLELTYSVNPAQKIVYFYHFSAPLPPRQTIFISYSHQDAKWLALIRKFLGVLEAEGLIKFWDDSSIKPGEPWEEAIRKALDSACAAVLLVSQDFLVSKFITTYELPRILTDAQRQGKKVFWLQVSPSAVFTSHLYKGITAFQSLTPDPTISLAELRQPKRQKVLVDVCQKLQEALGSN